MIKFIFAVIFMFAFIIIGGYLEHRLGFKKPVFFAFYGWCMASLFWVVWQDYREKGIFKDIENIIKNFTGIKNKTKDE